MAISYNYMVCAVTSLVTGCMAGYMRCSHGWSVYPIGCFCLYPMQPMVNHISKIWPSWILSDQSMVERWFGGLFIFLVPFQWVSDSLAGPRWARIYVRNSYSQWDFVMTGAWTRVRLWTTELSRFSVLVLVAYFHPAYSYVSLLGEVCPIYSVHIYAR